MVYTNPGSLAWAFDILWHMPFLGLLLLIAIPFWLVLKAIGKSLGLENKNEQ